MNKMLIALAKHSPKEYAATILARNESLLKKLMLLKPYIGKSFANFNDDNKHNAWGIIRSEIGCPHCNSGHYCYSKPCLWTVHAVHKNNISSKNALVCVNFPFSYRKQKGVSLYSFRETTSIGISYGCCNESISVKSQYNTITLVDWMRCYNFVMAHIEWAKLPCWGELYKQSLPE